MVASAFASTGGSAEGRAFAERALALVEQGAVRSAVRDNERALLHSRLLLRIMNPSDAATLIRDRGNPDEMAGLAVALAHLAVHRHGGGEVLLRLLPLACAPVELAETEVAVGDERAHAEVGGERQRLAVMGLAALGIEPVGMGRDVPEQVQSMGREPGLTLRGFDQRALAQAPCIVKPAEQQAGATERVGMPAATADDSPRRLALEELLAFPEPVQRLACLTELRQCLGGEGDRGMKRHDDVPTPDHHDPMLDQRARLRPVTPEEVEHTRGLVGQADGERMMHPLGEPYRFGFVLGRLGEPAELSEAHDEVEAIVNRCRCRASEILVQEPVAAALPAEFGA
jgi:hypothetical protein